MPSRSAPQAAGEVSSACGSATARCGRQADSRSPPHRSGRERPPRARPRRWRPRRPFRSPPYLRAARGRPPAPPGGRRPRARACARARPREPRDRVRPVWSQRWSWTLLSHWPPRWLFGRLRGMGARTHLRPGGPANGGGLWLDQALADRLPGELHPVAHPQLLEDVRAVTLDRLLTDHERLGDPLVAVALGHQLDDLVLARGQRILAQRQVLARAV